MLSACLELDAAGWLAAPGEDEAAFLERVKRERAALAELEKELAETGDAEVAGVTLQQTARVPEEFIREAGDVTERLYAFRISHIPGFFLHEGGGLLWGGCLITELERQLSFFLIRPAFRQRRRWLCYDRVELFAHELCHAMRAPLNDLGPDEYFAYQTSPSKLRRSCGAAFLYTGDALGFLAGVLLLLAAQLVQTFWWSEMPVWPFWLLTLVYPGFLAWRTLRLTRRLDRARRRLAAAGFTSPGAVLFRMTEKEIVLLGDEGRFPSGDLRWRIVCARFRPQQEEAK